MPFCLQARIREVSLKVATAVVLEAQARPIVGRWRGMCGAPLCAAVVPQAAGLAGVKMGENASAVSAALRQRMCAAPLAPPANTRRTHVSVRLCCVQVDAQVAPREPDARGHRVVIQDAAGGLA